MQLILKARRELAADGNVDRVVIASSSNVPERVFETMERIRDSALRHNRPDGVAAVLLAQSGWFVHWAEGPKERLAALMERVAHDSRHRQPLLLHHSTGAPIIPSPWSMVLSLSTEPKELFVRRVMDLRALFLSGRQFVPTSVLRRISIPMRIDDLQHAADAESFHRICICAASTQPAFDLLRWIGKRHGARSTNAASPTSAPTPRAISST